MSSYRVYFLTVSRNYRCFSLTAIHHHPGFLDLTARSQTAETAYLRRGSKLSSIEFSPSLQLLRSECELASGKKHVDPTVQKSSLKPNTALASPSPPTSTPVPPSSPQPPLTTKPVIPPTAPPSDSAPHAEHQRTTSASVADARDARIAQLQRDLAATQAALRAERAARSSSDDDWAESGADAAHNNQHQHSGSGSLILLLLGGGAAAVVGGALWWAGERDTLWWAALRDRYGDHYARATDPARVEPRYTVPLPAAGTMAMEAAALGEGVSGPALAHVVEADAVAAPVAVLSAAPVPGLVEGGVAADAKARRAAWKGWFWKSRETAE